MHVETHEFDRSTGKPPASTPKPPTESGAAKGNPVQSDPVQSDPVQSDPMQSDPMQSDPVHSNVRQSNASHRQSIASRLMSRCASGDQNALTELYALYSGYLLSLTKGIVRSTEEAQDVVQEVFLYVWRNASRYDRRRAAVSTWLRQIARSRAIDQLRKTGTLEKTRNRMSTWHATRLEPEAEREVLGDELRLHLGEALGKLPPAQQEVLRLAYFGGLTQTEIAERSSTPLGTVKTRTLLALRKLRAELQAGSLETV